MLKKKRNQNQKKTNEKFEHDIPDTEAKDAGGQDGPTMPTMPTSFRWPVRLFRRRCRWTTPLRWKRLLTDDGGDCGGGGGPGGGGPG